MAGDNAQQRKRKAAVIKAALFVALLAPAAGMAAGAANAADPVEYLTGETGEFALRILVAALLVSPIARGLGWSWLPPLRRMIGLYAFFYAALHFAVYVFLDLQLNFAGVWDDIVERKYITVGFAAFVLLVPLAITSNNALIAKMGGRAWRRLHRAVYIIAPLAVLHLAWQTRGEEYGEIAVYALLVGGALAARLPPLAKRLRLRQGKAA